jgi:alanyl-tRNA synthetase
MLGNFSFGDYFKADAIAFAFELLTRPTPSTRSASLHRSHRRRGARQLWKKIAGVGDDRVMLGLGDKDNFWAMGDTGPCGPCSEIHYHQGDDIPCAEEAAGGHACQGPACDCDRWIEIWNLVFMQFEQLADRAIGARCRSRPWTPGWASSGCAPSAGRAARTTKPTCFASAHRSRQSPWPKKPSSPPTTRGVGVSLRAIADHARAAAFLIADGVFPEKTGREYVLRRIMRRAVYHGWLLGIEEPFLARSPATSSKMGGVYPELVERRA